MAFGRLQVTHRQSLAGAGLEAGMHLLTAITPLTPPPRLVVRHTILSFAPAFKPQAMWQDPNGDDARGG